MIVSLLIWETPLIPAIERRIGEKITQCRTREEALRALPEADIVIVLGGGGLQIDDEMLHISPRLKLVLSISAGMEKLPLQALHDRDIAVCNAKGVHAASIAEYVVCAMLTTAHRFHKFYRQQTEAVWKSDFDCEDIGGKRLAVIGAGRIGGEIAQKAKALGMTVYGIKRHPEPTDNFDEMWGLDRQREALSLTDYAVMAAPLTPDTYHLMGRAEFDSMKASAVFINIARGDTVDEDALIAALQNETIAGAVLDVFHTEPLPPDSPLWTMDNVLVTPHSSGTTRSSEQKTLDIICGNIERFRNGQPLINQVQKGSAY